MDQKAFFHPATKNRLKNNTLWTDVKAPVQAFNLPGDMRPELDLEVVEKIGPNRGSGCAPPFESHPERAIHTFDRGQSATQTALLIAASFRI
jgi:hypothetical protein